MTDPDEHIWHSAAPRPDRVTPGSRLLGLLFVVVVVLVVLGCLVLVVTGSVST